MKRHWHSWLLFTVFVVAVLAAMGWLSSKMVTLQEANIKAQQDAAFEESVRLALWRMDAEISPMILEESSRPYYDYWAYNYNGQIIEREELGNNDFNIRPNASPLLAQTNAAGVNIYFQTELNDKEKNASQIESPQVLDTITNLAVGKDIDLRDNWRQLDTLNRTINAEDLNNALQVANATEEINADNETEDLSRQVTSVGVVSGEKRQQLANNDYTLDAQKQGNMPVQGRGMQQAAQVDQSSYLQRRSKNEESKKKVQQTKSRFYDEISLANAARQEPVSRSDKSKSNASKEIRGKAGKLRKSSWGKGESKEAEQIIAQQPVARQIKYSDDQSVKVKEDVMHPVWVNDLLILARTVRINGKSTIQGVWLNWENIKSQLLDEIKDLFPEAELVAADPLKETDKSRLMAAIPVKLIPGNAINLPVIPVSSYKLPLAIAWVFVLIGVFAVAILLLGTSVLSERRGAFVSAVTHELRTPLTTFRMYTEMLAEGMVKNEEKRDEYLQTLHKESNRLGHLVENVLAYSRLENGSVSSSLEKIRINDIIERVQETLSRRAEEAGMRLVIDISDENRYAESHTSLMTVEQILFNLVDNSCKYASSADDKRIHFAVTVEGESVIIRICDHGKGLQKTDRQIAFKPFRKSAEMAAESAPGVGLGLALCKRLAAQIDARIYYEEHKSYGACFTLRLPLS
ncbi:sensor histidine kinase [Verrucomicrobiota bacterium]